MVSTWRDNFNAAGSSVLQTQVSAAMVSIALDIQNEAQAGVSVPASVPAAITQQEMHNRRSALSYRALQGNMSVYQMSLGVAVNLDLYLTADGLSVLKATGDAEPTKAEIKNSLSAIWNAYCLDCKAV